MGGLDLGSDCFADLCILLTFKFRIKKLNLSRVMRKPAFCICENKGTGADQLSLFSLNSSYKPSTCQIRNFQPLVIFCDCTIRFCVESGPKPQNNYMKAQTGFLATRLIYSTIKAANHIYCDQHTWTRSWSASLLFTYVKAGFLLPRSNFPCSEYPKTGAL